MSNKKIFFTIVAIVVIIALVYMGMKSKNQNPASVDPNSLSAIDSQTKVDSTTSINAELNSVDTSSGVETDITSIDESAKGL